MTVTELIRILKDIEQSSGDRRVFVNGADIAIVYVKVNDDEEEVVDISS